MITTELPVQVFISLLNAINESIRILALNTIRNHTISYLRL